MIKQRVIKSNKYSCLSIFFALLTFACNNQRNKEKLLYSDGKLWQVEAGTKNGRDSTFYSFSKDGKWLVYKRHKGSKTFEKASFGDIQLIESWKFVNDSIINVGGMKYKIITLNDSCFKYSNLENNIIIKMYYRGDKL